MIMVQNEQDVNKLLEHYNNTKPDYMDVFKPEDFTCYNCKAKYNCRWSWDVYNMSGDCLADK